METEQEQHNDECKSSSNILKEDLVSDVPPESCNILSDCQGFEELNSETKSNQQTENKHAEICCSFGTDEHTGNDNHNTKEPANKCLQSKGQVCDVTSQSESNTSGKTTIDQNISKSNLHEVIEQTSILSTKIDTPKMTTDVPRLGNSASQIKECEMTDVQQDSVTDESNSEGTVSVNEVQSTETDGQTCVLSTKIDTPTTTTDVSRLGNTTSQIKECEMTDVQQGSVTDQSNSEGTVNKVQSTETDGQTCVEIVIDGPSEGVDIPVAKSLVYRDDDSSSSTSCSSDDAVSDMSEDEEEKNEKVQETRTKVSKPGFVPNLHRTKGELYPEDLPALEELTISVDEDVHMMEVGKVSSQVRVLVVIKANIGVPPLNEDTILFTEDRKPFGKIFEVFGPVISPFYSVRFNSCEEIQTKGIKPGDSVYCAPKLDDLTHYIFVDQLKRLKGSDASWLNNNEPPSWCKDFSDDEDEQRSKRKNKNKNKPAPADSPSSQAKKNCGENSTIPNNKKTFASNKKPGSHNNKFESWPPRNATESSFAPPSRSPFDWSAPSDANSKGGSSALEELAMSESPFGRRPPPGHSQPRPPYQNEHQYQNQAFRPQQGPSFGSAQRFPPFPQGPNNTQMNPNNIFTRPFTNEPAQGSCFQNPPQQYHAQNAPPPSGQFNNCFRGVGMEQNGFPPRGLPPPGFHAGFPCPDLQQPPPLSCPQRFPPTQQPNTGPGPGYSFGGRPHFGGAPFNSRFNCPQGNF